MIVNVDKFQAIVLDKRKSNNTDVNLFLVQRKFKLYHQLTH